MTPEDTMDMNKFQFAFYIEDYFSGELKDDPSLVTLFGVIFYMTHDNTLQNQTIGTHKCTKEDYGRFYEPAVDQAPKVNRLKKANTFYCLDKIDTNGRPLNTSLFGKDDIVVHRRLDIIFTPCIPQQLTEENKHLQKKMCLADLNSPTDLERKKQESIAYLKEPNLVTMTNKETLDITSFGEDTFKYSSHLKNQQFSALDPTWVRVFLEKSVLEDESELLNLGYSHDTELYNIQINNNLQKSAWTHYPYKYKFIS